MQEQDDKPRGEFKYTYLSHRFVIQHGAIQLDNCCLSESIAQFKLWKTDPFLTETMPIGRYTTHLYISSNIRGRANPDEH